MLQQIEFKTLLVLLTHQLDSFPISENVRKLKNAMASPGDKSQARAITTAKYSWPHLETGCHLGRGLVCSPIRGGRTDYQSP